MQVTIKQATSMTTKYLKAKLVPMIIGSPGMGKSAMIKQIAEAYNLFLIDIRLAQCDPTDCNGFPHIDPVTNKATYIPMDIFPLEGDTIPKGYSGWLLFFDEVNGAELAVQKAAYKIFLDRMIGNRHLHKNVAIVAAGNLDTDNAAVESMSTALQSRMVHIELTVDYKEWVGWATATDIDHRITSYIEFAPGKLYTFEADHSDKTYACPRTWEFSDRILKETEDTDPDRLPMLSGALSEGVAREFMTYLKIYADLPKMSAIEASPEAIKVPSEPSILFALTGSISHHITKDNAAQLMKFLVRLPTEFQIVCMRASVRRNKEITKVASVRDWIANTATDIF